MINYTGYAYPIVQYQNIWEILQWLSFILMWLCYIGIYYCVTVLKIVYKVRCSNGIQQPPSPKGVKRCGEYNSPHPLKGWRDVGGDEMWGVTGCGGDGMWRVTGCGGWRDVGGDGMWRVTGCGGWRNETHSWKRTATIWMHPFWSENLKSGNPSLLLLLGLFTEIAHLIKQFFTWLLQIPFCFLYLQKCNNSCINNKPKWRNW